MISKAQAKQSYRFTRETTIYTLSACIRNAKEVQDKGRTHTGQTSLRNGFHVGYLHSFPLHSWTCTLLYNSIYYTRKVLSPCIAISNMDSKKTFSLDIINR